MSIDANWPETSLGACATWFSGGTPLTSEPKYWNGDIPWISSGSLRSFYIRDSERRVTQAGVENGTRLIPEATVIFVVRGMSLKTEFRVGITKRPVAFGQDCKALIAKPVILPEFLADVLRSKTPEILSMVEEAGHGTGTLQTETIKALRIPLPSLDEQRRILTLIAGFDELIALLQQTNTTLKAIAQTVFQSWFIDFDPVKAKAEGREPEDMDMATAELFPREFEESELGPVPKGWEVATIGKHIQAERGLSYKGAGLCSKDEGVPMHNLNSVHEGGGYKYPGVKYYRGEFKERHLAVPGDIIVANTEQGHEHRLIGFPAIVPAMYPQGIYSHHIYRVRLRPDSALTCHTLYYLLMAPAVREQIIGCSNGSTVNMLKSVGLEIPRFVCPPHSVARAFEEVVAPVHAAIEANVSRVDLLEELRDTLLPRLISGKLRIPEAQAAVEEAALT